MRPSSRRRIRRCVPPSTSADLDVDPAVGLTAAEADLRLQRDGPNELRARPPVPLWRKILAHFRDPLVYLLLFAVVISVIAWVAEGAPGLPTDALVIAAVLATKVR